MKQEYILKNGIVLEYDGPKHTYKVNGKNIPSVTGITSKGLIKGGLTDWLINHPQGVAKKNINDLLDQGIELDRFKLEKIFEEASLSTDKIKKEAGLIGSVVHGLIEDFLNGKEIPNQSDKRVVNCWNIFLDWWNKQELKPIEIEKKLYSKKYNYAGTLDLIAENNKKELVLIDFKTSNQVSFDYYLQLNAYWYAYEEETGNKISEAIVVRLPKNAKKIDVQTIPLNQTLLNAFIGAKNIMTSMDDYWD
jgi:hypothetical protein